MTTAVLDYLRVQKKTKSRASSLSFPEIKINWKLICFAGFLASMALLVFYVWQINNLTRGYYLTNGYEKQIAGLSNENKNLEISFAESSFLGQALVKIQALDFQKISSVKYIQIPDNSLAVAQKGVAPFIPAP